jgi:hypothetical protein
VKHIPDWIPGTNFKKEAKFWRKYVRDSFDLPFQEVKERTVGRMDCSTLDSEIDAPQLDGTETPSMVSKWIHELAGYNNAVEREKATDAVRHAAGTALFGGYETVSKTFQ